MDPIYIQGSKKTCLNLETIIEELLEVVKNIDEWMNVPSSHLLFVHWLR